MNTLRAGDITVMKREFTLPNMDGELVTLAKGTQVRIVQFGTGPGEGHALIQYAYIKLNDTLIGAIPVTELEPPPISKLSNYLNQFSCEYEEIPMTDQEREMLENWELVKMGKRRNP